MQAQLIGFVFYLFICTTTLIKRFSLWLETNPDYVHGCNTLKSHKDFETLKRIGKYIMKN